MKDKLKKMFYRWAYMDLTGECNKDDSYFHRFSGEIARSNLRMMRSMSAFVLVISLFVILSTFSSFVETGLRGVYFTVMVLETVLLCLVQWALQKKISSKVCNTLTVLHLSHMLAIAGYIGVFYSQIETAVIFIVVLTISSMIFTLPTMHTMCISSVFTLAVLIASYYVKDRFLFESDVLNGVGVLIFSFMLGWKINQIRAEEAFARSDALKLNDELKKAIITDPLTGLYNHRSFQDNYYEMFCRASTEGLALGVIMMDLDNFKSFNDTYGHVAGDDCLSKVARAIVASTPKGAIVCRYGGEEFVALLNEELCHEAETIGEQIRETVMALKIPHIYATAETSVATLSLGAYVGVPTQDEQPMNFVERADKAMYRSKADGRNRLTVMLEVTKI